LSKKHGARKKRRKRHPVVSCPQCHSPADGSPGALLLAMAAVLNSCTDAGMKPKFAHGALFTREGVVLPPLSAAHKWAARTLAYNPLSPAGDEAGDSLDD
jgi:hypothetical protein